MADKHSDDHRVGIDDSKRVGIDDGPDEEFHDHHGQSVAAWTAVGILTVAAALICLSFPLAGARWPLLITGLVLVVVGLVAGKVLASNGYGIKGKGEVTNLADAPDTANRHDVGIS